MSSVQKMTASQLQEKFQNGVTRLKFLNRGKKSIEEALQLKEKSPTLGEAFRTLLAAKVGELREEQETDEKIHLR